MDRLTKKAVLRLDSNVQNQAENYVTCGFINFGSVFYKFNENFNIETNSRMFVFQFTYTPEFIFLELRIFYLLYVDRAMLYTFSRGREQMYTVLTSSDE